MIDRSDVMAVLAELGEELADTSRDGARVVVDRAVELVAGAELGSIAVVRPRGGVRTVASTSPLALRAALSVGSARRSAEPAC